MVAPAVTVTEAGTFEAPTIVDQGTLAVGSRQSLSLYGAVEINNGVGVEVGANGSLSVTGALTGGGTAQLDAGASLSVTQGSASTADTVEFAGPGGSLTLDSSDLNASGAFVPAIRPKMRCFVRPCIVDPPTASPTA